MNKIHSLFSSNKKTILYIFIIVIFSIFYLFPLLDSGYFGDDAINSLIDSHLKMINMSLYDFTSDISTHWVHSQGRFFPLAWLVYTIFTIFNTILKYKIATLIIIIINIFIWGYFLFKTTKSKNISFLGMIIAPIFMQFRICHEPILAYSMLMQLLFLYLILSLILFQKYLETSKKIYIVLSTIIYILGLLTYEITYLFFIFHIFIAFNHTRDIKKTIKKSLSIIIFALIAIFTAIYLRSGISEFNIGYTINNSIFAFFKTFAIQTMGGLPLNYFLFDPNNIFCKKILCIINKISANDILLTIIFVITTYPLITNFKKKLNYIYLIGFGILLSTIPGVLIALSQKQQNELAFGFAYLPVYIQFFGISLIFISVFFFIREKIKINIIKKIFEIIFLILITIVLLINLQNNRFVKDAFNVTWNDGRTIIREALQNDLVKNIPENSIILKNTNTPHDFDNTDFFYKHSGKIFDVQHVTNYLKKDIEKTKKDNLKFFFKDLSSKNIYFIHYYSIDKNNKKLNSSQGFITLGKVENVIFDLEKNTCTHIQINELYLATITNAPIYNSIVASYIKPTYLKNIKEYKPSIIPFTQMSIIKETDYLKIFKVPLHKISIELNSIGFVNSPISNTEYNNKVIEFKNTKEKIEPILIKSEQTIIHTIFDKKFINNLIDNKNIGTDYGQVANGYKNVASYLDGLSNKAIVIDPIELPPSFTVEIIIKPLQNGIIYNTIIGNHPGNNNNCEGFTIQQDGSPNFNNYSASFGTGNTWIQCNPTINFTLQPNKWHYLSAIFSPDSIKINIDGAEIINSKCNNTKISNSKLPLIIGNWIGGDRPFSGLIEELMITKGIRTKKELSKNMENFNLQPYTK